MSDVTARPAVILFVCTGNVCRSPYMEYRLRGMLAERGGADVAIGSAGTRALEGHPMAEFMGRRLRDRGVDASGFRATRLTDDALHSAGIVVTATREHRSQVVRSGGSELAERTFTLAQLSRLLAADSTASGEPFPPISRAPAAADLVPDLVAAALAARGRRSGGALVDDDLDDPWQRSRRTYRRVADRIDELLVPIAARLVAR